MVETISREELKAKLDAGARIKLIDVLNKESFERVHLPNSLSIPLEELEARAEQELKFNDEIIVYCSSFECRMSDEAYGILKSLGFENVKVYVEGIKDWMEAKYPLITRLGKKEKAP